MATLPGLKVGLTLDSATFVAETRRVNESVNRMGQNVAQQNTLMQRGFAGVTNSVKGLAASLGAMVTIAGAVRLATLAKDALDAAGNLGEMATQAGVTTRQLQSMQVAGVQVGVSSEQMVKALSQFGVRVGEAQQGTGELADTLERYGIATANSSGQVRSSIDILGDLADAVQKAGSEQERLSIVADAFGARIGPKLLPILVGGAAGFQQWAATAAEAGLILDDKFIAAADRASDGIATLQFAVAKGFEIGVVETFANSINITTDTLIKAREAGEALGRAIGNAMSLGIKALEDLRPFIETTIQEFNALVGILQKVFEFVGMPFDIGGAAQASEMVLQVAGLNRELEELAVKRQHLADISTSFGIDPSTSGGVQQVDEQIAATQKLRDELVDQLSVAARTAEEAMADIEQQIAQAGATAAEAAPEIEKLSDAIRKANSAAGEGLGDVEFAAANLHIVEARKEVEAHTRAVADAARAQKAASDEAVRAAERRAEGLADLRTEVEQLSRLNEAYSKGAAAVRETEEAIEAENLARQLGIKAGSDQAKQFANEITARNKLRGSIEAHTAAAKEYGDLTTTFKTDNEAELRLSQMRSQQRIAEENSKEIEDSVSEPFKNALKSVQSEFTNTFDEISRGTIRSFEDIAAAAHGIFTNMNSNMLSLAIFSPAEFDKISARISTDTGLPVSSGLLGGAAAATPLIGLASGLFGNQGSQQGISYGGAGGAAIGGIAGSFFGPGGTALGAIGGGLLGSITGGLLGGFLGGNDKDKSKGAVSGSLGRLSGRGEQLGEITKVLQQFDDQILGLLTSRQKELVDASLKRRKSAVEVSFKGELTDDVIRSATGQRARAIGTGLGFRNINNADDIGAALQTQRAIEELTNSTALFARQIEETSAQFVELRSQGRQFGISIKGLAEAQTKAVADLRKAQDAQIAALLEPFKALLAPLDAFKSRLDFTGLNPAEQFARAQADFQRISAEAAAGSIPAIQQFESAADLFVQLANQVGASPGQAAAVSQVEAALAEIRNSIVEAQADASRGVEDILDRADRNNTVRLDQLIELAQEQIRIQKKGGSKI